MRSFPDADALHLHPAAVDALRRGDAAAALESVGGQAGAAAQRIAGRALLALGDREGARRMLLGALADAAGDPQAQALAHVALASVARAMGEPGEAIGHLEWALVDAPPESRRALHREAATIAARAGLLTDAESHAREVLAPDPAAPDEPEMTVAEDQARLGAILSELGRDAEAVDQLRRAASTLHEVAGAGHVETLRVRAALAASLGLAGRAAQAEVEHRGVLVGRSEALGPDHPELAPTLLALSALRADAGDADAARHLADRALAVLDGRVAADHPLMAEARAARDGRGGVPGR